MKQAFTNILVPVDFSPNTEVAIAKAIDIIVREQATLHLLHVIRHPKKNRGSQQQQQEIKKLMAWKDMLEASMPWLSVHCVLNMTAPVEECIVQIAASVNADLIVVGKKSRPSFTSFWQKVKPSRIARQSGLPVLTVRPGSLQQSIKTVVVLVSEISPKNKMKALAALCSRNRPVVHLVAFAQQSALSHQVTNILLHLFGWAKDMLQCPVEYALLDSSKPAKELIAYAEKCNADVLLTYPERGTWFDLWNRHIVDALPAHSKMQVLTVHL